MEIDYKDLVFITSELVCNLSVDEYLKGQTGQMTESSIGWLIFQSCNCYNIRFYRNTMAVTYRKLFCAFKTCIEWKLVVANLLLFVTCGRVVSAGDKEVSFAVTDIHLIYYWWSAETFRGFSVTECLKLRLFKPKTITYFHSISKLISITDKVTSHLLINNPNQWELSSW